MCTSSLAHFHTSSPFTVFGSYFAATLNHSDFLGNYSRLFSRDTHTHTHTHMQKSINQLLRLFLDVLVFTYQYKHIENRRWKKYVVSSFYFLLSSLALSVVRFFLALEMFAFFPNMLRGSPSYISTLDASQWQSVFSIFSSSLPHLPRHPSLHLLPLQSSDEASQVQIATASQHLLFIFSMLRIMHANTKTHTDAHS